jgi:hypothetical protein
MAKQKRNKLILIHLVYVMQQCAYRDLETAFMYII